MTAVSPGAHRAAEGELDLAAIFAALPGAAVVFAADAPRFTLLAVSDALLAATRRPHASIVGRALAEAFPDRGGDASPAGSLASLRASLEAAVRTGAPQRVARQRYDLQCPEGIWETRYWDAVNVPVRGSDGAVRYVLHQTEDVTALVLGEAALARAERRAERVGDAHVTLDRELRFVNVNAAAERMVGVPREALLGRTHAEAFPSPAATALDREYRRVASDGIAAHFAHHYVGDGRDRHLEIDAYPTDEGGVAVFWRDVTDRLRADAERARLLAEVAAERERLRAVVLHMPAPLALVEGPEHRFALVNDAYKRVSGGGRDVTGLTPREAFPELTGSGIHELFERVHETGEPWVGLETPVRYDRDGTGVMDTWFDLRFEPVRDAQGQVVAILNFAVDVTEQVLARREVERLLAESERARAEAEAARAEAEAASRAKSEFLAVMSHELRTPLNAIGGYAELIELGIRGPVTDAQREDLQRIQRSQRALLGLINEVLNYARLETGAVTYDLTDVPVADAVAAAEVLVAPQLRAKGLGYAWAGADPGLAVRADRDKLQQILLNLLSNAVKFTNARAGLPGRVEVSCEAGDGTVLIRVRDTGVGVAGDKLEAIFEPFVQVNASLTRPHEGTGLGLAISRDLARGMCGDLTAESTPGVGSTFTLTLPRAHRDALGAEVPGAG